MKKIELSGKFKGIFTLVDDEDFEHLSQYRWALHTGYACHRFKGKRIFMHRIVNYTPSNLFTDHINRNKLDNRKKNLRMADKSLNGINRGVQKNNQTGHKNVCYHKASKLWTVEVHFNGKRIVKYFKDIKEAINQSEEIRREVYVI